MFANKTIAMACIIAAKFTQAVELTQDNNQLA